MADFKWYEQRTFAWASGAAMEEPSDAQVGAMLETLRADGWEDDPTNNNGSGWVNVRRLHKPEAARQDRGQMAIQREAFSARTKALEERLAAEVDGLGRILHGLGAEVESLVNWKKQHQSKKSPVDEIKSMSEVFRRIVTDVERMDKILPHHRQPIPPTKEPADCLGELLDGQYRGASWKLTVKGGTNKA